MSVNISIGFRVLVRLRGVRLLPCFYALSCCVKRHLTLNSLLDRNKNLFLNMMSIIYVSVLLLLTPLINFNQTSVRHDMSLNPRNYLGPFWRSVEHGIAPMWRHLDRVPSLRKSGAHHRTLDALFSRYAFKKKIGMCVCGWVPTVLFLSNICWHLCDSFFRK